MPHADTDVTARALARVEDIQTRLGWGVDRWAHASACITAPECAQIAAIASAAVRLVRSVEFNRLRWDDHGHCRLCGRHESDADGCKRDCPALALDAAIRAADTEAQP